MNQWQIKKLNEICLVGTGKHDANHATQNGKYKFYTCAKEPFYCDTMKFSGECLILPGNGVNVGEVFYYNGDFDAYQRTYVLSQIKSEAKFLHYHLLLYWRERNLSKQFGSATNFIKMENFLNYEISLPPIDEQMRIVGILYEVFEGVAKAKANVEGNLRNVSEVFEAYLQSVFADRDGLWERKTLKDVSITFGRGKSKHRPRNDKKLYGGKYPFIQTGDIRNSNHYITEYSQTYSEAGLALSKLWPKGKI